MRDVIFGLARPMLRLLGRDDRGTVVVLVAILFGGGVLLGIGALVLDVGRLYQNRGELQNGADAAALAVAKNCALSISTCTLSNATSTAVSYAGYNASQLTGHSAGVYGICVSAVSNPGNPGFTVGACPPLGTTAMTNCPSNPAGTNYVDVKTYTQVGGSHVLPPALAPSGGTVYACAQAEWGAAQQSNSLAITLSYCDWQNLTSGGSPFGTLIPVYLKGTTEKPCSGPAGQNIPGGFGWLSPTSQNVCTAAIDLTTNTTSSDPGNNITAACKQLLQTLINAYNAGNPVTVFLPVFGSASGTGKNATYQLIGVAGFVVTGYSDMSGGGGQNNYGPTNTLCTANNPCIEGYFKPGLDPVSDYIGSGTNFGAIAVKLSG